MKKVFILLTVLFATFLVKAQDVVVNNLQGSWKLVTYTNDEATLDIEKGTVALKEGFKKSLSTTQANEVIADYKQNMASFKKDKLVFTNSEVKGYIFGEFYKSVYMVNAAGNKITFITNDTYYGNYEVESEAAITIKGQMLNLKSDETELIYKKI